MFVRYKSTHLIQAGGEHRIIIILDTLDTLKLKYKLFSSKLCSEATAWQQNSNCS